MTRHGMIRTSAAGTQPPAIGPFAFVVIGKGDRAAPNRGPRRQHRPEVTRRGRSAFIPVLSDSVRATADIRQKSKSP